MERRVSYLETSAFRLFFGDDVVLLSSLAGAGAV